MTDRKQIIKDFEHAVNKARGDYYDYVDLTVEDADKILKLLKEQEPITGETSDGYHTFNELYHHRAILFSVIVANYPDRAWKSKKHNDGTMYNGMFIVGIETPDGQATYHYDIDPYWDMFECRVLDNAPEWDGHTPAQAIERIGKLKETGNAPITVTKLVRCKDCRRKDTYDCPLYAWTLSRFVLPDEWFCADGKRR